MATKNSHKIATEFCVIFGFVFQLVCVFFPVIRKRAEYGFGEYGFKHRTQWVFRPSPSSGERAQWVPLGLLFVCQSELTEFFAELTEFAVKLSEAQWVLFSETVLSKQYSVFFPVILLISCCFFHDNLKPQNSPPNEVTGIKVSEYLYSGPCFICTKEGKGDTKS